MIVRLCKTVLVATVALFFILVALGNITDYGTNGEFVRHVLAMDTIFPNSPLASRAITNPGVVALVYRLIIAWEAAAAVVLVVAAARLAAASGDGAIFVAMKPLAVLGLTMGLLLYGLGFIVVGGEWFAMWQSASWNGVEAAARFVLLDGLVLLIVLLPEAGQT
ncbi:MAG TPA: DUF2165 domain-containing protein [Stellaceae bacterium]|nr:DUF2165 domain-containing protein [Stellaceae bacterium]